MCQPISKISASMTGTYEREGGRDLYNPMEWLCPFPIHLSIYLFNLSNRLQTTEFRTPKSLSSDSVSPS